LRARLLDGLGVDRHERTRNRTQHESRV
jgi:hypothetical protein